VDALPFLSRCDRCHYLVEASTRRLLETQQIKHNGESHKDEKPEVTVRWTTATIPKRDYTDLGKLWKSPMFWKAIRISAWKKNAEAGTADQQESPEAPERRSEVVFVSFCLNCRTVTSARNSEELARIQKKHDRRAYGGRHNWQKGNWQTYTVESVTNEITTMVRDILGSKQSTNLLIEKFYCRQPFNSITNEELADVINTHKTTLLREQALPAILALHVAEALARASAKKARVPSSIGRADEEITLRTDEKSMIRYMKKLTILRKLGRTPVKPSRRRRSEIDYY
jgi:hypothetical protein